MSSSTLEKHGFVSKQGGFGIIIYWQTNKGSKMMASGVLRWYFNIVLYCLFPICRPYRDKCIYRVWLEAYLLALKTQLSSTCQSTTHPQLSPCIYKEGFSFSQTDGLMWMLMRAGVKICNDCNVAGPWLIIPCKSIL